MAKKDIKRIRNEEVSTINESFNFSVIEAYRAIRTNLNFAISNKIKCKKILFSSAVPGEGKTTTSINTAITIAQMGARVVIIDCDLRKSRVHSRFGIINDTGVSNVLSGMASLDEAIHATGKDNLWVITAGTLPPNPAELLGNENMKLMIEELEKKFDYIIIDTPPVNIVADALQLTKLCDGVVLVVKHKYSTHPSVKDALSKLEFAEANIIGIIMNGVNTIKGKYYRNKKGYQNYKYGYGYGH